MHLTGRSCEAAVAVGVWARPASNKCPASRSASSQAGQVAGPTAAPFLVKDFYTVGVFMRLRLPYPTTTTYSTVLPKNHIILVFGGFGGHGCLEFSLRVLLVLCAWYVNMCACLHILCICVFVLVCPHNMCTHFAVVCVCVFFFSAGCRFNYPHQDGVRLVLYHQN